MPRRRNCAEAPTTVGSSEGTLKKQSRYGQTPWQPGEIPTRAGALMPITSPLDDTPQPYGETMGVQKPANRGTGANGQRKL